LGASPISTFRGPGRMLLTWMRVIYKYESRKTMILKLISEMRIFRPTTKFYIGTAVTAFLFSYFGLLLLPGFTLLREADTFWQIRIGQWILENAKVPSTDFYSYTAFGKRWISGQWLSEILFALAFNIAQWRGVVILSVISCSAITVLLWVYLARNLRFS